MGMTGDESGARATQTATPNMESKKMNISTDAENLNDVKQHTLDENHVRGIIEDVDTDNANVKVRKLTTGEMFTERMPYPETWTSDHKFTRLVEQHGLMPEKAEELEGRKVKVNVEDRDKIVVSDTGLRSSTKKGLIMSGMMFSVVPALMGVINAIFSVSLLDIGMTFFIIGNLAAFVWMEFNEEENG